MERHYHKKGQKLLSKEVDERLILKLDKTIKSVENGVNGVIWFGENNDYPQLIEKLINGSGTAKMVANVYAKFLTGLGFENEAINNIVVGKDSRGKEVTVLSLLRQCAISISKHNGFYVHCNVTQGAKIHDVHMKPFKDCRFAKFDDKGYTAKILVYNNWLKDNELVKYDKKNIKDYNVFNLNPDVVAEQIRKSGRIENYKGQIFFQFFDDEYFYPLSNFDPIYLDCDTEAQNSLYKNRQIRNGFTKKTIVRVQPQGSEEEKEEFVDELKQTLGPDGTGLFVMEDDIDDDNELSDKSAYRFDQLDSNIDDKLFENWDKSIPNSIRKSGGKGIPAILIDYEEGKLSMTSGESIMQACNYYNAIIKDDQKLLANSFKEFLSKFDNTELANNQNWNINPLQLIEKEIEESVDQAKIERLKGQAALKSTASGVESLLLLQAAVSNGSADVESAVTIVMEIYGIQEDIARKMIGTPKIQTNGNTNNITTAGI
jgi:hypothetical protein